MQEGLHNLVSKLLTAWKNNQLEIPSVVVVFLRFDEYRCDVVANGRLDER